MIRVKAMNDGNNQLLQWMLAPKCDGRNPSGSEALYCQPRGSTCRRLLKNDLRSYADSLEMQLLHLP